MSTATALPFTAIPSPAVTASGIFSASRSTSSRLSTNLRPLPLSTATALPFTAIPSPAVTASGMFSAPRSTSSAPSLNFRPSPLLTDTTPSATVMPSPAATDPPPPDTLAYSCPLLFTLMVSLSYITFMLPDAVSAVAMPAYTGSGISSAARSTESLFPSNLRPSPLSTDTSP